MADDHYKRPVIIYDYPKAVKPFYVRLNDDGKTVAAFDMVVPKVKPKTWNKYIETVGGFELVMKDG